MSEQSPEKASLNEEPEVEGHLKTRLNEDPSVFAEHEAVDEEGPEVEGHMKAKAPVDKSF